MRIDLVPSAACDVTKLAGPLSVAPGGNASSTKVVSSGTEAGAEAVGIMQPLTVRVVVMVVPNTPVMVTGPAWRVVICVTTEFAPFGIAAGGRTVATAGSELASPVVPATDAA